MTAKALMAGEEDGGIAVGSLGIVGGFVGGFGAATYGLGDPIEALFDASIWLAAIVGSLLILLVWRALPDEGRTRSVG